jgi:hypothetical protein
MAQKKHAKLPKSNNGAMLIVCHSRKAGMTKLLVKAQIPNI